MIRAAAIDSGGHFTNSVYAFCKKNQGRRIFAIKGVGGDGKAIAGKPSKNNTVKCPLFPIGVDTVKDLMFSRLKIKEQAQDMFISRIRSTMSIFDSLQPKKPSHASIGASKSAFLRKCKAQMKHSIVWCTQSRLIVYSG